MPRVTHNQSQRDLDFDPSEVVVDDLKQECRLRHLPTSGTKAVLVLRLRDAIARDPSLPRHRLTSTTRRKKRVSNKREPQRDDFDTEAEYKEAWQRWREVRDHNNVSVKRSRQAARQRKEEHERLCQQRERENQHLVQEVTSLQTDIQFLQQALQSPADVSPANRARLTQLMARLGPIPQPQGVSATTSAMPMLHQQNGYYSGDAAASDSSRLSTNPNPTKRAK